MIDAAARAEQLTGHQTLGIAVSGSTSQRLGHDSPALAGQTLTLDALVARVDRGMLDIGPDTTIYFDEAGMADTDRLDRVTETVERTGAKLVAIGDGAQLPSIGAGGMFDRLARSPPAHSSRTSVARWTPPNSARGRTCAPAVRTARWPTTTPKVACTWPTPATRW